jgi:hypothetical protein
MEFNYGTYVLKALIGACDPMLDELNNIKKQQNVNV